MAKKVLIVEDSDATRSFMKILVEGCGYQVLEAFDGEEAIKIARYEPPDLILIQIVYKNTWIQVVSATLDKIEE